MSSITETNKATTNNIFGIRTLTVTGMLAAISVVLMLFEIPLWFAPSFYKIDLSEIPALIGAFTFGPIVGVLIELIKILINLLINGTDTAGIGEAANFIFGCAIVLPSVMIYQKKKTKKSAAIGLFVGTILLVITGSLINAYVLLPTYASAFHMPMDGLIAMGSAVNPSINSLSTFILLAVAPFNLIKGIIVSIITLLIYKKISPVIKGTQSNK